MGAVYATLSNEEPHLHHDIINSPLRTQQQNLFRKWTKADVQSVTGQRRLQYNMNWGEFFITLAKVEEQKLIFARQQARKVWYEVCAGYTMIQLEKDRPPLKRIEKAKIKKKSIFFNDDNLKIMKGLKNIKKLPALKAQTIKNTEENKSSKEREKKDDEDSGSSSESENDKVEKADVKSNMKQDNIDAVEYLYPQQWDPETRNPIFFGYSLDATVAKENEITQKREKELVECEELLTNYFNSKKLFIGSAIQKVNSKREGRAEALFKFRQVNDSELKMKATELEIAKEILDLQEFEIYEKNWNKVYNEIFSRHQAEDTALISKMDEEEKVETEELAIVQKNWEKNLPEAEKLIMEPRGSVLFDISQIIIAEHTGKLNEFNGKKGEEEAKLRTEMAKKKDKIDNNLVNQYEDAIKNLESEIAKEMEILRLEEIKLEKSRILSDLEDPFLGTWNVMSSKSSEKYFEINYIEVIFLLIICCGASLDEKLWLLFNFFDKDGSKTLTHDEMVILITTLINSLERVGKVSDPLSKDDVLKIVSDNYAAADADRSGFITMFEFILWAKFEINRNQELSLVFNVPWKFNKYSDYQRKEMSIVHKYRIGMINKRQMTKALAGSAVETRPELDAELKNKNHELALAFGSDDPTKPDYTKFLPKRGRGMKTNVVPLLHGAYRNLVEFALENMTRYATRLQANYRGRIGRYAADREAERQMFFKAEQKFKDRATKQCEMEFNYNEKSGGIFSVVKWKSKVRLKQLKLKIKGRRANRKVAYDVLLEEAINIKHTHITEQFDKLATQHMFLRDPDASSVEAYLYFRKEQFLRSLSKVQLNKKKDEERKKNDAEKLEAEIKRIEDHVFNKFDKRVTDDRFELERRRLKSSEGGAFFIRKKRMDELERYKLMQKMTIPPNIFFVGFNIQERQLIAILRDPNPNYDALLNWLRSLNRYVTKKKATDLLLELPSKQLIIRRVNTVRTFSGLKDELLNHFQFPEECAEQLAITFRAMARLDLDTGVFKNRVVNIFAETDLMVQQNANEEARLALLAVEELHKKKLKGKMRTEEEKSAFLKNIREEDATAFENLIKEFNKSSEKTELARVSLIEAKERLNTAFQKQLTNRVYREKRDHVHNEVKINEGFDEYDPGVLDYQAKESFENEILEVRPCDQFLWVERFISAVEMPEITPKEMLVKYDEIYRIHKEFGATAAYFGRVIIREYFLPLEQKSIKPVASKKADAGGYRYKFEICNIRFKLATDEHGICNASDEMAAKGANAELRGNFHYQNCGVSDLFIPFEIFIDYLGFRILATAVVPISIVKRSDSGKLISKGELLVLGSNDRGDTIKDEDDFVHSKINEIGNLLNMSVHGVKGFKDLTAKFFASPADLRVYKGSDNRYHALNFARAFPPEMHTETPHLKLAPRGNSIFWRYLRPELVLSWGKKLCPDALSCFIEGVPGYEAINDDILQVTRKLIREIIPIYAEELTERAIDQILSINWTQEFHSRGINMRHLGWLRTHFWRQLDGDSAIIFGTKKILVSKDMSREVIGNEPIEIDGRTYIVDDDPKVIQGPDVIFVKGIIKEISKGELVVTAGLVKNRDAQINEALRLSLFSEIAARSIKQMVKLYLRQAAEYTGFLLDESAANILISIMNLISGCGPSASQWWNIEVAGSIVTRYGSRSISEIEKTDLLRSAIPLISKIVLRMLEMLGVFLHESCIEKFIKQPAMFCFVISDLKAQIISKFRGNVSLGAFSSAMQIFAQAQETKANSYVSVILKDKPVAYWRLNETISAKFCQNLGNSSPLLNATISKDIKRLQNGFALNDGIHGSKCMFFGNNKNPCLKIQYDSRLAPKSPDSPFSIEAMCCVNGGQGTRRSVVMTGRMALVATANNKWAFIMFLQEFQIELPLTGIDVVIDEWVHLMGTYDGTIATFYCNGNLLNKVDVDKAAVGKLRDDEYEKKELFASMKLLEEKTIEMEMKKAKEFERDFMKNNDEGQRNLTTEIKKVQSENQYRLRMQTAKLKKMKEEGKSADDIVKIYLLTPEQAAAKAENNLLEKRASEYREVVVKDFQQRRDDLEERRAYGLLRFRTRIMETAVIGCGCSNANASDGEDFFSGHIQHVAIYEHCIPFHRASLRYLNATNNMEPIADRFFIEAAKLYKVALGSSPFNKQILKYHAEAVCNHYVLDKIRLEDDELYQQKIYNITQKFKDEGNVHGVVSIAKALGSSDQYADLACNSLKIARHMDPEYFANEIELLSSFVDKFDFNQEGNKPSRILEAAEIFKYVTKRNPTFYAKYDFNWLHEINDPGLVCFLIRHVSAGHDHRILNLKPAPDATSNDIDTIGKYMRDIISIDFAGLKSVNDVNMELFTKRCKFLNSISLDHCNITDKCLMSIGDNCSRVEYLSFAYCKEITDEGLQAIARGCVDLKSLNVNHTGNITDFGLVVLADYCHFLFELKVSWNINIADKGLLQIIKTINPEYFTSLDISGCRLLKSETIVDIVKVLKNIKDIKLEYNSRLSNVAARGVTHNLLQLENVSFMENVNITDDAFIFDENDGRSMVREKMLLKLKSIDLTECSLITAETLKIIGFRCKNLSSLILHGCVLLGRDALIGLTQNSYTNEVYKHMKNMVNLNLTFNELIDDECVTLIAERMPKLESLNLTGCLKITDQSVSAIGEKLRYINVLSLAHCRFLTDRAMEIITEKLYVEELDISGCNKISDDGLLPFIEEVAALRQLRMNRIIKATDKILISLRDNCPILELIDISCCDLLTEAGIMGLKKNRLQVKVIQNSHDDFSTLQTSGVHISMAGVSVFEKEEESDNDSLADLERVEWEAYGIDLSELNERIKKLSKVNHKKGNNHQKKIEEKRNVKSV